MQDEIAMVAAANSTIFLRVVIYFSVFEAKKRKNDVI